jgi:hypothetical protein
MLKIRKSNNPLTLLLLNKLGFYSVHVDNGVKNRQTENINILFNKENKFCNVHCENSIEVGVV